MKSILESNNRDLLREIDVTVQSIRNKNLPEELKLYQDWLYKYLNELQNLANLNLYYLSLNESSIFPEILDKTQSITRDYRVLSSRFLSPVTRYNDTDILCLKFLQWMHSKHKQSQDKAFAVSDGVFSIFASTDIPLIYFLPTSSQQSLLHIPLFFHEFGHYLYAFHRQEMDDMVIELQNGLEEYFTIPFQQNDSKYHREKEKASAIIETWYDWAQELFCDAVGLHMGGPSYLYAFSHYLRMLGRGSFYIPERDLFRSSHPVAWMRVKFLVERARRYGLNTEAKMLEEDWKKLATTLNESGNYHGFYKDQYNSVITDVLDRMLVEAEPIYFVDFDFVNFDPSSFNFIQLLNRAWINYNSGSKSYVGWESDIISTLKSSTIHA